MAEKEIGIVSTYFGKAEVAAIKLAGKLKIGDKIHIKGHTTDSEQVVDSMQINKKDVKEAKKGNEIGIKIKERVRPNDKVFIVS